MTDYFVRGTGQLTHVSIVIPTFNSAEHIGNNLSLLRQQDFELRDLEIIVVDGFSSDGTDRILSKYANLVEFPRIRVLKKRERNIAAARNLGISEALGQIVVFLDSDCYPLDNNWLRNLVSLEEGQGISVGRNIVPERTLAQRFVKALDQLGTPDLSSRGMVAGDSPNLFATTNVAIRKEVFTKVGLLDERIGSFREDTDFSWRAKMSGVKVKYRPEAVAVHEHRSSVLDLWRKSYERSKNAVGFYQKYGLLNRFTRSHLMKTFTTIGTFLLLFTLFMITVSFYLFVCALLVLYSALFVRFVMQTKRIRDSLVFPFIYAVSYLMVSVGTFRALATLVTQAAARTNKQGK